MSATRQVAVGSGQTFDVPHLVLNVDPQNQDLCDVPPLSLANA